MVQLCKFFYEIEFFWILINSEWYRIIQMIRSDAIKIAIQIASLIYSVLFKSNWTCSIPFQTRKSQLSLSVRILLYLNFSNFINVQKMKIHFKQLVIADYGSRTWDTRTAKNTVVLRKFLPFLKSFKIFEKFSNVHLRKKFQNPTIFGRHKLASKNQVYKLDPSKMIK